jgi:N-methylhydantoinase A
VLERGLDVRYRGQGYELNLPFGADFEAEFHRAHERRYGYADPQRATEVVNVRVRALAASSPIELPSAELEGPDAAAAIIGEQPMFTGGRSQTAKLVDREKLRPGNRFTGPALVVEYSTTTVLPEGLGCRVDERFNLVLERRER